MAVDPARLELHSYLGRLEKMGEEYKINYEAACHRLNKRTTREQFVRHIDEVSSDKLPVLKNFLMEWARLLNAARQEREAVQGSTPKSVAPSLQPALVSNSSAEVKGLSASDLETLLARHNDWRRAFHAPELVADSVLSAKAQAWADHLATRSTDAHNPDRSAQGMDGSTGENIYSCGGTGRQPFTPNHQVPVDKWGSEVKDWDADKSAPKGAGVTGHFTQVVWKNTQRVGFGFALIQKENSYRAVWVCNYHPAGNYAGQHAEQVGKR